jgi:hypothetical protein
VRRQDGNVLNSLKRLADLLMDAVQTFTFQGLAPNAPEGDEFWLAHFFFLFWRRDLLASLRRAFLSWITFQSCTEYLPWCALIKYR